MLDTTLSERGVEHKMIPPYVGDVVLAMRMTVLVQYPVSPTAPQRA